MFALGLRRRVVQVRMLNYKADSTPFWNSLHVAPIRCSGGKVCARSAHSPAPWH